MMQEKLFALADPVFRDFQRRLIPNIEPDSILGVRTPRLRQLVKDLDEDFLARLPHRYFEENQIHALALCGIRDFDQAVREVERFLPYVDNWATCDQLRPRVFGKNRGRLMPHICRWLQSEHVYTVRFAMEMLMCHYLDADFDEAYLELVASVHGKDYYVRMMQAWYFATALAKQYEAVLPYIENRRLDRWVHNKTIQKAAESFRVSDSQKGYLRQYRIL